MACRADAAGNETMNLNDFYQYPGFSLTFLVFCVDCFTFTLIAMTFTGDQYAPHPAPLLFVS